MPVWLSCRTGRTHGVRTNTRGYVDNLVSINKSCQTVDKMILWLLYCVHNSTTTIALTHQCVSEWLKSLVSGSSNVNVTDIWTRHPLGLYFTFKFCFHSTLHSTPMCTCFVYTNVHLFKPIFTCLHLLHLFAPVYTCLHLFTPVYTFCTCSGLLLLLLLLLLWINHSWPNWHIDLCIKFEVPTPSRSRGI